MILFIVCTCVHACVRAHVLVYMRKCVCMYSRLFVIVTICIVPSVLCLPATLVYKTGQFPIFGLSILETTANTTVYVLMDPKTVEYDIYWISPIWNSTLYRVSGMPVWIAKVQLTSY